MDWNTLYPKNAQPTLPELSAYVDSPLWEQLHDHLKTSYGVVPKLEHSVCSGAPGWNLKYKKGGRIDVTTPEILEDVKALIALRMKRR